MKHIYFQTVMLVIASIMVFTCCSSPATSEKEQKAGPAVVKKEAPKAETSTKAKEKPRKNKKLTAIELEQQELGLTDEQRDGIKRANDKARAKRAKAARENKGKETDQELMKKINGERNNEIKALLGKELYSKRQKYLTEQRKKRKKK